MDAPLLLRDTRADFWQAALADAADRGVGAEAYLKTASRARSKFLDSGVVHNRDEFRRALLSVFESTGQFGLLLGGKNVGKSLLLSDLSHTPIIGEDDVLRAVVKIDARTCGTNLTAGLVAAIGNEDREQKRAGIWSGPRRPQSSREPQRESFWAALRANWPASVTLSAELPYAMGLKGSMEVGFSKSLPPVPNMALLDKVLKIVDDN